MFSLKLAWREGRSGLRKIGVYMVSITLGVGALVAIHSFREDVVRSVQSEARAILGADLRLGRNTPFSDSVRAVVDSLAAAGADVAEVTTLASMVYNPRAETTRLLQVRAVGVGYPFYGAVVTDPAGGWARIGSEASVWVDRAVLTQLSAVVGDTLQVGVARFVIRGTVEGLPTDIGLQSAVGPRLYLSPEAIESTGLLAFGSLARYEAYIRTPSRDDPAAIEERYRDLLRAEGVSAVTSEEQAENLTEGTRILTRFLGLIGLAALLLGGIGVGSAIHVYVRDKLTTVAVLRCLGAKQRTVFVAYLLQAAGLGALGAGAGVVLGLMLQRVLPRAVQTLLPVPIQPEVDVTVVLAGLVMGIWVAVIFALLPLLAVRDVSPLQALRRSRGQGTGRWSVSRALSILALAASIAILSLWQAPTLGIGAAFAGGLAVTLLLLWAAARMLIWATRRFFPARAPFAVRQGVSNLFRPQNQTVAVTLALGFGVFLIASVFVIERSLQQQLNFDRGGQRANLLLFDLQSDQRDPVVAMLGEAGAPDVEITPIVTSRIEAINGVAATELLADSVDRPAPWAVRRTYRNTYRSGGPTSAEEVIAGQWWDTLAVAGSGRATAGEADPERTDEAPVARISLEGDLAFDLDVGVGDRITWNVQGALIESEIVNLRRVDWARFQTNFFVVFEPGVLENEAQTLIGLARVADENRRLEVQRDLVQRFPNVSILDLAQVQEALDKILGTVSGAIRFLAAFSVLGGLVVLIGALATSRFQRMRESALLKTLGGQRKLILRVLFSEYAALGLLGAAAGILLGTAGAALVLRFVFSVALVLPGGDLVGLGAGVVLLAAVIGLFGSRGVLGRPPLAVLREVAEG